MAVRPAVWTVELEEQEKPEMGRVRVYRSLDRAGLQGWGEADGGAVNGQDWVMERM